MKEDLPFGMGEQVVPREPLHKHRGVFAGAQGQHKSHRGWKQQPRTDVLWKGEGGIETSANSLAG